MSTQNKRAFSLIEILIAIAIVALAASLAIPVVNGNRDRAAYRISVINLKSVGKAMEKHFLETGAYPVFTSWAEVSGTESPLLEYLNEIPKKDGFNRPYEVKHCDETSYEFLGFSIKGKLAEDFPDYRLVTNAKIKTKSQK